MTGSGLIPADGDERLFGDVGVRSGAPRHASPARGPTTLGCPDCGALQIVPAPGLGGFKAKAIVCRACGRELERTTGRSADAALACACSALVLLIPANLLPFLTTSLFGVSRQSWLISSATSMWTQGWPTLAIAIILFVIVAPIARFGLLSLVLGSLRLDRRPSWLGPAFRWADQLQIWAMPDVFLLGLWVAHARLQATVSVQVGAGAYCFIGVGLLALFTRATLNKAAIWREISPEKDLQPGVEVMSCPACELLAPFDQAGARCPRCSAKLSARKPLALSCGAALTIAALILYVPANLYPMATIPIGVTPTPYTVLQGVKDLIEAHLPGLALLVFSASFAIPFIKLAGIGWCVWSVLSRSARLLETKTATYRLVEEIGRWSMVDPFVIACFVPVTQFNASISSSAGPAAPIFTGVVILTMIAAQMFDPRLMWDAARRRA